MLALAKEFFEYGHMFLQYFQENPEEMDFLFHSHMLESHYFVLPVSIENVNKDVK